ncbi:hypothetical protein [Amycolatopsis sp. lyj-109]|uniref:hypothetical protein n=1 Tax=Amycolatopsis sp. lyj-109 TaxID=2789287 RepID=UPI00397A3003
MKKRFCVFVVAVTTAVMAVVGQSPATASPVASFADETAYLQRDVTLSPTAPKGSTADIARDIYLRAGTYTFDVSARLVGQPEEVWDNKLIKLNAGTYRWYVAFVKPDVDIGGYKVFATLATGNLPPAQRFAFFGVNSPGLWRMQSSLARQYD